ncbi:exodeoxyribonuclease VII large subunit, partial [Thermodesulfobacteriota bacterium]
MNYPEDTMINNNSNIYTVSALTEEIKNQLEDSFDFVWVEAEISNFSSPSSGHFYMVFKDEQAQIRAVMFRPQTRYLKFRPEDGMKVIAQGRISVYEPRGEYQIILDYLEPLGVGAMALAFEQLKKKLAAQGVFDEDIKRPLPFLPKSVAVITSPTGAAIRDFIKILQRRFINIEITVVPVKVQGDEATSEIVDAIETVNEQLKADIIVITRGGGSIEDLWAFNREEIALAIRKSRIPVVSAVGHETDTTISDLAADVRAPTPSAAAELIVAEKESLQKTIADIQGRLQSEIRYYLNIFKKELSHLSENLTDPRKNIADSWMRLDDLNNSLNRQITLSIKDKKEALASRRQAMMLNSPENRISSMNQSIICQRDLLSRIIARKLNESEMNLSLYQERIKARGT